jgi:hypothetical protein
MKLAVDERDLLLRRLKIDNLQVGSGLAPVYDLNSSGANKKLERGQAHLPNPEVMLLELFTQD